ncbi:hypothetical protein GCM10010420_40440 [Streptomyces glaucosporus]|uniref:Activator of Hsp90 ATPase homologue 1/2-like C-terminal domain-containing protein n=1 Tax=Streptomyces glaucosporus TaxID=284044 RepID=A0ABN3ILX0_9ACTN
MGPSPTGRLFRTDTGFDLVLTRTFPAPAEDVWADIAEPDRTARWFGPWEGDAAPGRTVRVRMAAEDRAPWSDLRIEACQPPRRLAVSMTDESGTWRVELLLSGAGGSTELRLVHHLGTAEGIGEIGPGWEYYLDRLVAARDGLPEPDFAAYFPAMRAHFEELSARTGA